MASLATIEHYFDNNQVKANLSKNLKSLIGDGKEAVKKDAVKTWFLENNSKIAEELVALVKGAFQVFEKNYVSKDEFIELKNKHEAASKDWDTERQDLINQIDSVGQYSRRDNIKIIGIEPKSDEDVEKIVIDVARDAGVDITKDDISIAHRIHTKDDASSNSETNMHGKPKKIPSIIARIKSRNIRNKIFAGRKALHTHSNPTHTGARLYDDLTPLRSRILFSLRNKKVDDQDVKKYKFVWTREGRIFARTEEESQRTIHKNGKDVLPPPHIVNKAQDLKQLGWSEAEILAIINNKMA